MPRQIVTKVKFEAAYRHLPENEKRLVDKALENFQKYLDTGEIPGGLGVKHLGRRTYEFRAGLALRIIYVVEGEQIILALLGSHDEVRRFLRRQ